MSRPVPLDGIRVIDLTQVLAGPYCTYQLALLGAEVIKVEKPGGENTRWGGGIEKLGAQGLGLSFCGQNADKDCIEVDLKTPAGVQAVLELVDQADILVQNFRPGVADRLGVVMPPSGNAIHRSSIVLFPPMAVMVRLDTDRRMIMLSRPCPV